MSDLITIQGKHVLLTNGRTQHQTVPVDQFVEALAESTVRGLDPEPLPDNVKWPVQCGTFGVYIVQLTPALRCVKWLAEDSPAPYGPRATYRERRLATPYVILKVPFCKDRLIKRVEVFYRNEPLKLRSGAGGELFWPNLLNVSANAYDCTAWYCTQYLSPQKTPGVSAALDNVVHHLFGGGFNASSEHYERESTFGLCKRENVDPRVTDPNRWEQESEKDPKFILQVNWKPTGLTVEQLIERELAFNNVTPVPASAPELGNILLRKAKPK